jgi:hypothetical protein
MLRQYGIEARENTVAQVPTPGAFASQFRFYYYFLFGFLGGLTGWFASALLAKMGGDLHSVSFEAMQGAMLGAMIGCGTAAYDGFANRSFARFANFAGTGMLLGLFGGGIALPVTQAVYSAIRGGNPANLATSFVKGTICWIIFGGVIGLGEGIGKGSQVWKGVLGGVIGGGVGGAIYETMGRPASIDTLSAQTVLAMAVGALGASIACSIALVTTILKNAWLEIESGKLAGTEMNVSKYVDSKLGARRPGMIGSSADCAVYLPGDAGILPHHATLSYVDGQPTISAVENAGAPYSPVLVNGRIAKNWGLRNGDRIQIGSTFVRYRHR